MGCSEVGAGGRERTTPHPVRTLSSSWRAVSQGGHPLAPFFSKPTFLLGHTGWIQSAPCLTVMSPSLSCSPLPKATGLTEGAVDFEMGSFIPRAHLGLVQVLSIAAPTGASFFLWPWMAQLKDQARCHFTFSPKLWPVPSSVHRPAPLSPQQHKGSGARETRCFRKHRLGAEEGWGCGYGPRKPKALGTCGEWDGSFD